ncbi:MAG: endonuclease/exonuclease/phosphatase family protein, partial [Calditrichota bacterium]
RSIYPHNGTHGIGVYSKHPILNTSYLYNSNKLPYAQIVEINAYGKRLQVINTHLASPAAAVENPENFLTHFSESYKERTNQLERLEEVVESSRSRIDVHILTGDLNTTRYEPLYRQLKSKWVDLFDISGRGRRANFPNSANTGPLLIIDYILIAGKVGGISARVLDGGSSDHLAIEGKIRI